MTKRLARKIGAVLLVWVVCASLVDRFRNPELTETQLLMRLPSAMAEIWR